MEWAKLRHSNTAQCKILAFWLSAAAQQADDRHSCTVQCKMSAFWLSAAAQQADDSP